jgi:hypothetical protein
MKQTFILLFCACFCTSVCAQEDPSIGLRGGLANGVSLKWFLTGDTEAIEGIITFRNSVGSNSTFAISALYELHNYDFASDQLRWYYGAGPHLALGSTTDGFSTFDIGLDGIIGIEYRINEGPISLSADWKPSVAVIGNSGIVGDEGAITLRFQL